MNSSSTSALPDKRRGLVLPPRDMHGAVTAWDLVDEQNRGFRLRVAATRQLRERAYRLAGTVYSRKGFQDKQAALCCSRYDLEHTAFTVLAIASGGSQDEVDAGTISLFFDGATGMPCDEIYHDALLPLRTQGRRLVEVGRLAISVAYNRSKHLLVALFNAISIQARRVAGCDDLIIEVNPRHVDYYRRILAFEVIGEERPCPRVADAPAVLLRLDLSHQIALIEAMHNQVPGIDPHLLYGLFLAPDEEAPIARLLRDQHRPMSMEDARAFGLIESLHADASR